MYVSSSRENFAGSFQDVLNLNLCCSCLNLPHFSMSQPDETIISYDVGLSFKS